MGKTFKKGDLIENLLDEEELNELIDSDGSMIDAKDNFKSTDNDVKSKGTTRDRARRSSQGPSAFYPWGGAYYGGYYGMNEEDMMGMDVRDEFDEDEAWSKPQRDIPQEYLQGIPPREDGEGKKNHDDYPDKRKDIYQGFFEDDIKEEIDDIAESKMQGLVDEMLNKRQNPKGIVKRQNETDLMHDVVLPDFTELKSTYEKPIVARKIEHLTNLINKHNLGGTEISMIFNYLLDNLDISKFSDEQREYIGDKLKYGEQEKE
tara:strand:+ start:117 stop:899 length:783 start_codon:yes stop_codon:yes gene_type:complete